MTKSELFNISKVNNQFLQMILPDTCTAAAETKEYNLKMFFVTAAN